MEGESLVSIWDSYYENITGSQDKVDKGVLSYSVGLTQRGSWRKQMVPGKGKGCPVTTFVSTASTGAPQKLNSFRWSTAGDLQSDNSDSQVGKTREAWVSVY